MLVVDGARYTNDDILGTLRAVAPWWEQLTAGRNAGATASIGQGLVAALRAALGAPPGTAGLGPEDGDLVAELDRLARLVEQRLARPAQGDGDAALGPDALTASLRALAAAGEALRAAGALPATATGTVAGLHVSDGGLPKRSVERAVVGRRGLQGDRQATRRHHGRPWQAVCLWSAEVINDFARGGHPISYRSAGENITVIGVDWARVRPGVVLDVGSVRCEVVAFALPCKQNARWFRRGEFDLMHHRNGPVARTYALVTRPGRITSGD